jgi:hypothetical protein
LTAENDTEPNAHAIRCLDALPVEDPGKQESTKFTHPCVERSILYNVGETAVSVECARECVLASTISCASFASLILQETAVLLAKTMDGRALSYDFSTSTDSDLGKSKNPGSWRCCSFLMSGIRSLHACPLNRTHVVLQENSHPTALITLASESPTFRFIYNNKTD